MEDENKNDYPHDPLFEEWKNTFMECQISGKRDHPDNMQRIEVIRKYHTGIFPIHEDYNHLFENENKQTHVNQPRINLENFGKDEPQYERIKIPQEQPRLN